MDGLALGRHQTHWALHTWCQAKSNKRSPANCTAIFTWYDLIIVNAFPFLSTAGNSHKKHNSWAGRQLAHQRRLAAAAKHRQGSVQVLANRQQPNVGCDHGFMLFALQELHIAQGQPQLAGCYRAVLHRAGRGPRLGCLWAAGRLQRPGLPCRLHQFHPATTISESACGSRVHC